MVYSEGYQHSTLSSTKSTTDSILNGSLNGKMNGDYSGIGMNGIGQKHPGNCVIIPYDVVDSSPNGAQILSPTMENYLNEGLLKISPSYDRSPIPPPPPPHQNHFEGPGGTQIPLRDNQICQNLRFPNNEHIPLEIQSSYKRFSSIGEPVYTDTLKVILANIDLLEISNLKIACIFIINDELLKLLSK